jgi:hypothetical protein
MAARTKFLYERLTDSRFSLLSRKVVFSPSKLKKWLLFLDRSQNMPMYPSPWRYCNLLCILSHCSCCESSLLVNCIIGSHQTFLIIRRLEELTQMHIPQSSLENRIRHERSIFRSSLSEDRPDLQCRKDDKASWVGKELWISLVVQTQMVGVVFFWLVMTLSYIEA